MTQMEIISRSLHRRISIDFDEVKNGEQNSRHHDSDRW